VFIIYRKYTEEKKFLVTITYFPAQLVHWHHFLLMIQLKAFYVNTLRHKLILRLI